MSPTENPSADNRRVPKAYSKAMLRLLKRGSYNAGTRPSEHTIGEKSFLTNNSGAIPPNVLTVANTKSDDPYQLYCRANNLKPHPARMPFAIPEFFIKLLTEKNDVVLDPFAGSNTTGAVAQELGRRWVSMDPVGEYVDASRVRFPTRGKSSTGRRTTPGTTRSRAARRTA
jgi:site-specific DNA-methyltransferase (cytosine-N4-specific)